MGLCNVSKIRVKKKMEKTKTNCGNCKWFELDTQSSTHNLYPDYGNCNAPLPKSLEWIDSSKKHMHKDDCDPCPLYKRKR